MLSVTIVPAIVQALLSFAAISLTWFVRKLLADFAAHEARLKKLEDAPPQIVMIASHQAQGAGAHWSITPAMSQCGVAKSWRDNPKIQEIFAQPDVLKSKP